jgi:hypothetical protein
MMWIFTSNGFLSIVSHRQKPEHLLVRARNVTHLKTLFPNAEHFTIENADYPYRAVVHKDDVADFILKYIQDLDYDNFKNSVTETDYLQSCNQVWSLMYEYGIPLRSVE